MTHLNIQQGSNVEIVTALIIKKLYDAALSVPEPLPGEEDAAYMSGNLLVNKAYRSLVEYLTGRFDDLSINITVGYYIPFEDSAVLNVLLANNIGSDGIGVTEAEAANATLTTAMFKNNTNITSFDEFKYFTKANTNPPNLLFMGCSNLSSVDLSNVTTLSFEEFKQTALTNVDLTGSTITSIPKECFRGCSSLTSVILPNTCLTLADLCFRWCTSLTTIDLSNIKTVGSLVFLDSGITSINLPAIEIINQRGLSICHNCGIVDLGPNLSSIGDLAFWDSAYTTFIFRGTTVPTFNTSNSSKFLYNMNNVVIYVPESALSDYQTAWPQMASNMVKIEGSVYDTQS